MRNLKVLLLGAAFLACTSASAFAQDDKMVHVNVGGGPTFVSGDFGTHFSTGWGPAIGVTIDAPSHKVAFEFEYAYRYFQSKNALPVGATAFAANHSTHQLDFNIVANLTPHDSNVRGYLTAGPGFYYRNVDITQYAGTGVICDPFWYVCGAYPVTAIIATRGGWDPGFNIGGGVGFRIGESSEFYIETRYHYVWGPDIQPNTPTPVSGTTTGGKANGQYWPLTFGFRF
jgi:outer membrane protein with beta-barrel domain